MTDTTNTSAAALAMRDAAAALARRRPLYDGASGEPADEDLAQAIEDLPLPDVDTTDWKAEAERLRAELAQAREVLSSLEWDSWGYDPYGEGRWYCPCCGWTKDEGHEPDCALSAALAAKGE